MRSILFEWIIPTFTNTFQRLQKIEDLIILKAVAHRPKDLLDIESVLATQPVLDKEYICTWVQQFAEAMEMPELWDDLSVRLK